MKNLGFYTPHNLPDKLKIRFVSSAGEGEELVYTVSFADNIASITIRAIEQDVLTLIEDTAKVFANDYGIISYIVEKEDMFLAMTAYNGYTYYITAYSAGDINTILENLY